VTCEYLDRMHPGPKLFPPDGAARMTALRRQALGDGFLDFLLLWRDERARAQPSDVHLVGYAAKRKSTLAAIDREVDDLAASAFSIGHIALGCALGYLDFRFAAEDWRGDHPRLARWHADFGARPSVQATQPIDDS
jgi:glutathione S-transferase